MSSITTSCLKSFTLATLVFASAAHACDIIPTNDGGFAANCAETNDSGRVYVWDTFNRRWQQVVYYRGWNAQYLDIYYYGARVWAIQDRATYEIGWVAYEASGWVYIPYMNYSAALYDTLQKLLAAVPQSTAPSTPMIPMAVPDTLSNLCADYRTFQAQYTPLGAPKIPISLCGF